MRLWALCCIRDFSSKNEKGKRREKKKIWRNTTDKHTHTHIDHTERMHKKPLAVHFSSFFADDFRATVSKVWERLFVVGRTPFFSFAFACSQNAYAHIDTFSAEIFFSWIHIVVDYLPTKKEIRTKSVHTNTIAFPSLQLQIPDILSNKKNCFDILCLFLFLLIYFNFVLCFTGVFTFSRVPFGISYFCISRPHTYSHCKLNIDYKFSFVRFPIFFSISCRSSFLHRCYTTKFQMSLKLCLLFDNSIGSSARLNLNLSYFKRKCTDSELTRASLAKSH